MKTIRMILAAFLWACVTAMSAQDMGQVFTAMPAQLVPYLDAAQKKEMIEFVRMGISGETTHSLQGKCRIDTLTADYLRLTASESMTVELKRLPAEGGDTLICVVRTWLGPQAESRVDFYRPDWTAADSRLAQEVERSMEALRRDPLRATPATPAADSLRAAVDFVVVSASLSAHDTQLTLTPAVPTLPSDYKELAAKALLPVTLSWNGSRYEAR